MLLRYERLQSQRGRIASKCSLQFPYLVVLMVSQRFAHVALLINVGLTVLCGMVHTLYVAYHENLKILAVLESTTT